MPSSLVLRHPDARHQAPRHRPLVRPPILFIFLPSVKQVYALNARHTQRRGVLKELPLASLNRRRNPLQSVTIL
jgi:hypothetical protein